MTNYSSKLTKLQTSSKCGRNCQDRTLRTTWQTHLRYSSKSRRCKRKLKFAVLFTKLSNHTFLPRSQKQRQLSYVLRCTVVARPKTSLNTKFYCLYLCLILKLSPIFFKKKGGSGLVPATRSGGPHQLVAVHVLRVSKSVHTIHRHTTWALIT